MDTAKYVFVSLISAAVLLVAGCGSPQSAQETAQASSSPTSSVPASAPAVASLIDPRWMGFETGQTWDWQEVERRIAPGFQRFGFRPPGETNSPRPCQGCGVNPPTAEVTVYSPGVYDPSGARTGQPVGVNGRGGFVGVPQRDQSVDVPDHPILDPSGIYTSVLLVWEYDDDAWATVRGMTPMTGDLDSLLELARAVRPDERTPVRVPLSLGFVPAHMPLVGVHTDFMPIYDPTSDYGTTLSFGPCVTLVKAQECFDKADETGSLGVQILRRDEYRESRVMHLVDRQIGGERGKEDTAYPLAEVLLERGYVEFNVHPRGGYENTPEQDEAARRQLDEVLKSVTWAANPGDESTWQPITEWVK